MQTVRNILSAALLFITLPSFYNTGQAQSINTEAALKYWEITDALRQNKPLTDEVWEAFLQLEGNKVYVEQVFNAASLKHYRRAMEVVYMPQHDSLLQARLEAGHWYYVLVNDYKTNEAQHRKFLKETSENPQFLDLMYTLSYEYLPRRAHKKVQDLKMYYTALGGDATSQEEGIFFSIYSSINTNLPKAGILEAHEMHHQLVPRKDIGEIADADLGLLWALYSILNEGPADLIDKKPTLAAGGEEATEVQEWLLDKAPTVIQRLDSTIQVLAKNGSEASQPIKYYSNIMRGSGGHMPGFYMASVIDNNGYLHKMLENMDKPFTFIRLYQKAAKKDKLHPPVFSKASMAYLKRLEKKYSGKQKQERQTNASL